MKIACLQFAPQVGDVDNNLNRADSILNKTKASDLEGLDLLVLPELAFSGYNYQSLQHITPFLEPPGSGISSLWARTTALKYDCAVVVGYPEKVDVRAQWPASPEYYNSVLVVNGDGDTVANYRKSHLYYTDETWALEGKDGFYHGEIPGVGDTVLGIGMDLNPYKFEAQWDAFEFGFHAVAAEANVVVLTMAWNTEQDTRLFSRRPTEPDLQTLVYWVQRLEPLIRAEREGEVIVVCCNRTGSEDDVMYAGTSAVIGILAGEVYVYGVLGRGVKELLVVDTDNLPLSKLTDAINVETEYSYVEDMGEEFGTAEAADQLPQAVSSEVTMIEEDALQQEAPPPATPQEEDDDEDDLGPLPSSSISQFPPSDLRGDDRVKNLRSQLKLMIPTGPCINDPTTIETAIDEDDDDDDVIIDSPGVTNPPSPVQPMKLPKLTIPSSPWRFRRKPSPYPWQYKDGGGSQVFGGGKVCMTPVTPFDTGSPMVSAKSGPQSALSWRPTQAISYIIGSPIPENEVAVAGSFKHNSRKSSRQSSLERRFKIDLFSPDSPRAFEPPRKKVANKLDTMAVVAVGGGSEGAAASESIPHATTASDQQCKVEIIDNEQDAAVGEEEEPQSPVAAANLSELSAVLEGLRLAQGRPVSEISIPNLPPPLCEPAQNPCPDRPFSPKSHNASRNHSRNTSRSRLAQLRAEADPYSDERATSVSRGTIPISASPSVFDADYHYNRPQSIPISASPSIFSNNTDVDANSPIIGPPHPHIVRPGSRLGHRTAKPAGEKLTVNSGRSLSLPAVQESDRASEEGGSSRSLSIAGYRHDSSHHKRRRSSLRISTTNLDQQQWWQQQQPRDTSRSRPKRRNASKDTAAGHHHRPPRNVSRGRQPAARGTSVDRSNSVGESRTQSVLSRKRSVSLSTTQEPLETTQMARTRRTCSANTNRSSGRRRHHHAQRPRSPPLFQDTAVEIVLPDDDDDDDDDDDGEIIHVVAGSIKRIAADCPHHSPFRGGNHSRSSSQNGGLIAPPPPAPPDDSRLLCNLSPPPGFPRSSGQSMMNSAGTGLLSAASQSSVETKSPQTPRFIGGSSTLQGGDDGGLMILSELVSNSTVTSPSEQMKEAGMGLGPLGFGGDGVRVCEEGVLGVFGGVVGEEKPPIDHLVM